MPAVIGILWLCSVCHESTAFSVRLRETSSTHLHATLHDDDVYSSSSRSEFVGSRREWTKRIASSFVATSSIVATGSSSPAFAVEDTIWKTGKAPIVPGQKPKDKGDTKGTKKDPSFLRSVSDCRSKCENTPGPDGLAKSSNECLAECQDICCTTYEQCTFAIVPR